MNKEITKTVTANSRTPLSRAKLFIKMAKNCSLDDCIEFEALIDASIVFARSAIERYGKSNNTRHGQDARWQEIWNSWKKDTTIMFFTDNRNLILHEAPLKINQRLFASFFDASRSETITSTDSPYYADLYYFNDKNLPATEELENHLMKLEELFNKTSQIFK